MELRDAPAEHAEDYTKGLFSLKSVTGKSLMRL